MLFASSDTIAQSCNRKAQAEHGDGEVQETHSRRRKRQKDADDRRNRHQLRSTQGTVSHPLNSLAHTYRAPKRQGSSTSERLA